MQESESEVSQLCLTLSDPMDCSLPGSSVHGIFQARVLEWGAIAFSRLRDWTMTKCPVTLAHGTHTLESRTSNTHEGRIWYFKIWMYSKSRHYYTRCQWREWCWEPLQAWGAVVLGPLPGQGLGLRDRVNGAGLCLRPGAGTWARAPLHQVKLLGSWAPKKTIVQKTHVPQKWYEWTYLRNRDRLTDIENKLTVTERKRWGRWGHANFIQLADGNPELLHEGLSQSSENRSRVVLTRPSLHSHGPWGEASENQGTQG